jgi:pilus assembly protein CpaF
MGEVSDPKKQGGWRGAFGPLAVLLDDPRYSEIMINGAFRVFVEQNGILKKTPIQLKSQDELVQLMVQIAKFVGKELSEENPYVDARLPDGSRVNLILPPTAVDGPSMTIRKFPQNSRDLKDLVQARALDDRMAFFLHSCVTAKINMVVSGGTGSGKTTLLNALSFSIDPHERLVTIEDAAELRLKHENLVRLESRPRTPKQVGISIRDLVINALRMRPDRIIVGECRGMEALDMLNAMNTGHEGSLTTIHANSARDSLRRLESMVMIAGTEVPIKVIRTNISSSLNLIVHIARFPDGTRRIQEIIEVAGMEGDTILTQPIFRWDQKRGFHSSGLVPSFMPRFVEKGVAFPPDFFTDAYTVKVS